MTISAGIDVGAGAVKAVVMRCDAEGGEILAHHASRIRRREVHAVIREAFTEAVERSGAEEIHYIASTGEGEEIAFATGHFYGMTTHARGALYLEPAASSVLDVGALHARAVAMDPRGKVLGYKMTSQCASGSGQFLENISRYLGVSQSEIGRLSLEGKEPEKVSSICAVLAETDVINMVSRGISPANILRGIHESMAGRFVRLLRSLGVRGVAFVSGGLAADVGLLEAIRRALAQDPAEGPAPLTVASHPLSIQAGAIGAAIWGAYRYRKMGQGGLAWKASVKI